MNGGAVGVKAAAALVGAIAIESDIDEIQMGARAAGQPASVAGKGHVLKERDIGECQAGSRYIGRRPTAVAALTVPLWTIRFCSVGWAPARDQNTCAIVE